MTLATAGWWNSAFEFILMAALLLFIRTASETFLSRGLAKVWRIFMLNASLFPSASGWKMLRCLLKPSMIMEIRKSLDLQRKKRKD